MSLANGAKRAPGVALWLFTLAAIYVALHRSGVYGLVADAQNLIAIFGVLRAIAFSTQARRANPDAGRIPGSSVNNRSNLRLNAVACVDNASEVRFRNSSDESYRLWMVGLVVYLCPAGGARSGLSAT
jgi:hypothetical protein